MSLGSAVPQHFPGLFSAGPSGTVSAFDITMKRNMANEADVKPSKKDRRVRGLQQAAVTELSLQALGDPNLKRLFSRTVTLVAEVLDVELCKILRVQDDGRCLLCAGVGWKDGYVGRALVATEGASQAGFTLQSKEPVIVEDLSRDGRFSGPPLLVEHGVVCGVSVVIEGSQRPYGVLGVHSRQPRDFSPDDVSFLQSVANLLANAVERQRSEDALRRSEETTRAIVNTCIDGIVTIDEAGIIRSFNPAAEKIFGFPEREAVGQPVHLLMPKPDRERHDEYLQNYLKTGLAKIIGFGREVVGVRRDGGTFPMHLGVGEMQLEDHRMFVGLVRDLTYFKKVQEELMQAQNLAAIGEMAASVAHEIKNPLAAILGVIQVLRDSGAIAEDYQEVIEELSLRVGRLDQTVKRLLNFAKPIEPDRRAVDLVDVIEQIVGAVRRDEPFRSVEFQYGCAASVSAPIDLVLFEDLLRNLLYNAADAMPGGGTIMISCQESNGEVAVSVRDTGIGIRPEVLQKVFRPFYTTKRGGTGLGLALCKKIVEAHGGTILISSQPGTGTEVVVSLPL